MISEQEILSAKILIVDDQKLQAMFLEQILKNSGYKNIFKVTNYADALRGYQNFLPNIVLIDVETSNNAGFDLIKQCRRLHQEDHLPILALSTEKGEDVHLQSLAAGASDFLIKPYDNAEVLARVRNMIEIDLLDQQVRNQNKILEAKVKERTKELSDTRFDIIRRLAKAAEFRDNDTGVHIIRMSKYCARLGAAAGLSESQCELLLTASPLHDVGKIGIPDEILLKPGKLTPEEFEIMKTHTTIGAEILSGSSSPLMKMAEIIALTHHEKWDGTGYPRKLKGDDIPLVGRICAVCDVFDALTTKRPYKDAWPVEEAVEQIKKDSTRHFDPKLVECFITVLPDITKIRDGNQL